MKKQSFFFKLFIALTLFIAVPVVVIASILGFQTVRYSEDEISKSAIRELKAAENLNKLIAENLTQRALEMTIGTTMNDLNGLTKYSDILSNPDGLMRLYNLQIELNDQINASTLLHSVYLYIDDSDFIFTTNQGVQSMKDFADTGWISSYERFSEVRSGSSWMSTRTVKFSKDISGELGASNKVITFFYAFTPYITNVKGVLVFNIFEQAISKRVNDSNSISDGYIEIVNTNGDIISHIDDDMIGRNIRDVPFMQMIENSNSTEGHLNNISDNKRQLITYYKSDYNNWIYIGVFPVDSLMAKINRLKAYTIYICFVFIIIGILISYLISKRIYSPLNKLVQDIRTKKGIDIKSNESEMSILSSAFDILFKEEARLFFILEQSRNNTRNVYLMNLFQGKANEDYDNEMTGIEFPYSDYISAVILIDKYHEFRRTYSEEQQEYMKMLILKVSEQLLNSSYKCAGMVYEKQKIIFAINFETHSNEDFKLDLKNCFIKIQEEISRIFDNSISIGIGNCQKNARGLGDSFDKAQEALRYKLISGRGSINFWQDVCNEDYVYYYPFEFEKHIFNLINTGNKDKLEEIVSALIREIRNSSDMHYDNVIQVFNQLAGNTVKFLLDLHCNISMIFGNNFNMYHSLTMKETLDDIKDWFVEIYSTITDYLQKSKYQYKSYYELALDYIHMNYRKDIDINEIAEHVGLSYSHLRKIFKDETGENIVNYVNNLRINESKRLLCQTNLTIREISINLGYNNDQSFVRFFKKYEGISPSEFRVSNKGLGSITRETSVS